MGWELEAAYGIHNYTIHSRHLSSVGSLCLMADRTFPATTVTVCYDGAACKWNENVCMLVSIYYQTSKMDKEGGSREGGRLPDP